ncbi:methyl-accepting chemotaxis protein [Colwellia ponticola]|nr:methyl-accepting chemotaxis protein [Colwellia ponticola]
MFRLLTIKTKLMLIIAVAILAVISSKTVSLNDLWTSLNDNKRSELKNITEVAYSIITEQDALVKQNKISLAQAQLNAKKSIAALTYGKGEYFFLFDQQYNMVMHPRDASLEKSSQENLVGANGVPFFKNMIDESVQSGESFVNYVWPRAGESEPVSKTSYGKFYAPWGWGVATGLYTDDIDALYLDELKAAGVSTFVVLLVLIGCVYKVSSSIIEPLETIENQLILISETKDLSLRASAEGKDELADMGRALNSMLDSFNNTLAEMLSAAHQVASSSTELSATTNQTLMSLESQKSETLQVASAMTQMSATVHEVANNTSEAAQATHGASNATNTGKSVLLVTKQSVQDLVGKLNSAESLIYNLEKQTANISSILTVISGIAEQTNLLALNAAIEAARAGEQGRGFAVVADEVRSLSSRTHESTNEIHQVISELQAGSLSAVKAMKESKQAADLVEEQTNEAEQALANILTAVEHIDAMASQIAVASEQQSSVAEEVNRNINNISQISEETATGGEQTAIASEELAQLATRMTDNIQQFTLSAKHA